MHEVEDAVPCECDNDEPQRGLEARKGEADKNSRDQRLDDEDRYRAAHDGKECVVRCDDNHHNRVQRAVSVKAKERKRALDDESQNDSDYDTHMARPGRVAKAYDSPGIEFTMGEGEP